MIQQTEYVIAGVTPQPYGYETGGILIYDYTIPIEILEPEIASPPEAKHGVYEPYQWITACQAGVTQTINADTDYKFTQKYVSGNSVNMTAILQYKIDPTKIKKINYDVTVELPHHSSWLNNNNKFNFYLTDTLSNAYYNYATPQVPVLWRSELWDDSSLGENIGSIVLENTGVTKPCFLAIGALGWSFVINNIDFEEV